MATRIFSIVIIAFGLIDPRRHPRQRRRAGARPGSSFGVLFVALGAGRLYLALRDR